MSGTLILFLSRRPRSQIALEGASISFCPDLFSALTHREPLPENRGHSLLENPPRDSRDLYPCDGERLRSPYRIPLRDPGLSRTGSHSEGDLQNPGGRLPLRPHPALVRAGGLPNVVLNFTKSISQGTTSPRYFFGNTKVGIGHSPIISEKDMFPRIF